MAFHEPSPTSQIVAMTLLAFTALFSLSMVALLFDTPWRTVVLVAFGLGIASYRVAAWNVFRKIPSRPSWVFHCVCGYSGSPVYTASVVCCGLCGKHAPAPHFMLERNWPKEIAHAPETH